MFRATLCGLSAFVQAACTLPQTVPQTTPQPTPQTTPQTTPQVSTQTVQIVPIPDDVKELSNLVEYYGRVAAMRPSEQRRAYAEAGQAYSRDPTPYNRIRVALLASMPGTPVQDDARALSLLEPYTLAGSSDDKLRQFGAMLHGQIAERVKARARTEQLEKQLDALRAVERTIIERGQPEAPAKH
jgi:hypothetical protein